MSRAFLSVSKTLHTLCILF